MVSSVQTWTWASMNPIGGSSADGRRRAGECSLPALLLYGAGEDRHSEGQVGRRPRRERPGYTQAGSRVNAAGWRATSAAVAEAGVWVTGHIRGGRRLRSRVYA